MHVEQFRLHVLRPTLKGLGLYSVEAEQLLLGTIAQESNFQYIDQITQNAEVLGPACGLYQMERATHDDIWKNYINHRPQLRAKVDRFATLLPKWEQMAGNLYYATAMARVFYLRFPAAIPTTLDGQAEYWKKYWNTHLGKGTAAQYRLNYKRFVEGK